MKLAELCVSSEHIQMLFELSLCLRDFFFFFMVSAHHFLQVITLKQLCRGLARRTGVKKKKAVCSAAVMPNKAAKAAQTRRLSEAPSASMMHAVEMNPCTKVSLKRSLSLAAYPSAAPARVLGGSERLGEAHLSPGSSLARLPFTSPDARNPDRRTVSTVPEEEALF